MKKIMKLSIYMISILMFGQIIFGQSIKLEKYYEWYEKGYIIKDMSFDNEGKDIAIAKEFKIPSGGDAIDREDEIEKIHEKIKENPRYADPIIYIMNLESKEMTEVDYGSEVEFSHDGKKIVYIHQLKPLSGFRELAETLKGNTLNLYDIKNKTKEVLATPQDNFLMNPQFIDDNNIVYQIGDAINGVYGGGVGLNKINIENKKIEIIAEVRKDHNMFNIISKVAVRENDIYYLQYIPQDEDTHMASEYTLHLKKGDEIFHDFGTNDFINLSGNYAVDDEKNLVLLNSEMDAESVTVSIYKDAKEISNKEVMIEYFTNGILSPNGKYIICQDYSMSISLINIETMEIIVLNLPKTTLYQVKWSNNCDRVGIIQEHEQVAFTDIMTLFRFSMEIEE
ncbi:hypothetical protein [Fusobacterium sp. PH5-44]|uniref:hypothetical protein n=1 Tax=unclassified Fusobacterium TaxID=2648384 RepID=UPI003D19A6AB